MNCKEVKNILFDKSCEELTGNENELLLKHIEECDDCKSIAEKMKISDNILKRIQSFEPGINDPDLLSKNIIKQIELLEKQKQVKPGLIDKIILYVEKPKTRFSLAVLLLLILSSYFVQEFSAVNNILDLEKRLNKVSSQNFYHSQLIPTNFGALGVVYKLYKFLNNDSDYFEVSNNVLLIRKDKLVELLGDYDRLDDVQKQKVNSLKKELFGNKDIDTHPGLLSKEEIKIDKQKFEKALRQIKAEGVYNEK
jgi:hypothetical protein